MSEIPELRRLERGVWRMRTLRPLTRGIIAVYAPLDSVWDRSAGIRRTEYVREAFPSMQSAVAPQLHSRSDRERLREAALRSMVSDESVHDVAVFKACEQLGFMGGREETVEASVHLARAINTGGNSPKLLASTLGLLCFRAIENRQVPAIRH